jgi:hypothetical protein
MRWKPSAAQLSLITDCATARMPAGSTAALHNISPRTLRAFLKRLEAARAQNAISSGTGG